MPDNEAESLPVIESWDTYWQGAQASAAYTGGGTSHPLVLGFWADFFRDQRTLNVDTKIIDIASGNGALVDAAQAAYAGQLPDFTCLDVSDSAIRMLENRFPGVHGLVADAADIPLPSASFNIATSQFGVEYAGLHALDEVTRLIASGGSLALLLHYHDGLIYRECSASLQAVTEMQTANFIPYCMAMFEAGFAALDGGDRARYGAAGKQFAPAISAMEAIMIRHGREVAAGTILRVYRDVRTIHSRMRHYESTTVIGWLEKMQHAIEAYSGRMASMREAAIDAATFETIRTGLTDKGFEISRADPLTDQGPPVAWAVIATKE